MQNPPSKKPLTITFLKEQLDSEISLLHGVIIAEADYAAHSKKLSVLQAWRVSLDLLEEPLPSFLQWLRGKYVVATQGSTHIPVQWTNEEIIEQYNGRNNGLR